MGHAKQGDDATMANPRILHMLTPLKHMSPFDVNMALDAGYDAAIPYTNVTVEDVTGLVQDAIFSRGPEGVKRTGMFIGGKRAIEALDMMDRAKKAMVPPFEISVFADPAGSFTTAAAMVACAKKALKREILDRPQGQARGGVRRHRRGRVCLGGDRRQSTAPRRRWSAMTGPSACGSSPRKSNARFDIELGYADGIDRGAEGELVREAEMIFAAGPAGARLLTTDQLKQAKNLLVAADVNAVPPSGVEGVGVNDNGKPIPGTNAVGIGALAIGNIKYKTEAGLFKR